MNSKGFTIVEVVIGVIILASILGAAWQLQSNLFFLSGTLYSGFNSQDEVRRTFRQFGEDVRPLSPSSLGSYSISQAADESFVFYTDTNGDGVKERVRYFLDNTTLRKGVIIPSGNPLSYASEDEDVSDLIHNIITGTPIFEYFDTEYTGTSEKLEQPVNILDIRLIKIIVTTDSDPNRPPSPKTFTTQITPRNLKDNL